MTSQDNITFNTSNGNDHQFGYQLSANNDIDVNCGGDDDKQAVITTASPVGDVITNGGHPSGDDPKSSDGQSFEELVQELQQMIGDCVEYLAESEAFESQLIPKLDQLVDNAVRVKTKCGSDAKDICNRIKQFSDFANSLNQF